mmetsp:Transcript_61980/g.176061  ORF Transcript_61980/g.176061 Transcript_61980/m.176061 type:complete len:115 (+) Transcript_61980:2-346(+)
MAFLKKEAGVYFGLKGTIKDFDKLASEFLKATDKAAVVAKGKEIEKTVDASQKDAAAYYVRIMEKSAEKGDWWQKEHERLRQIIDGGKVAPGKKDDMQLKVNRLSAFVTPHFEL